MKGSIDFLVTIDDVNDHSPTFLDANGEAFREFVVEENMAIGHELGRVYAVDEDGGQNGEIHYKMIGTGEDGQPNERDLNALFELDEWSGVLKAKVKLDRERRHAYRFKVDLFFHGKNIF